MPTFLMFPQAKRRSSESPIKSKSFLTSEMSGNWININSIIKLGWRICTQRIPASRSLVKRYLKRKTVTAMWHTWCSRPMPLATTTRPKYAFGMILHSRHLSSIQMLHQPKSGRVRHPASSSTDRWKSRFTKWTTNWAKRSSNLWNLAVNRRIKITKMLQETQNLKNKSELRCVKELPQFTDILLKQFKKLWELLCNRGEARPRKQLELNWRKSCKDCHCQTYRFYKRQ